LGIAAKCFNILKYFFQQLNIEVHW